MKKSNRLNTWTVRCCGACPFYPIVTEGYEGDEHCNIVSDDRHGDEARDSYMNSTPPPSWCPLRVEEYFVSLSKETKAGGSS